MLFHEALLTFRDTDAPESAVFDWYSISCVLFAKKTACLASCRPVLVPCLLEGLEVSGGESDYSSETLQFLSLGLLYHKRAIQPFLGKLV